MKQKNFRKQSSKLLIIVVAALIGWGMVAVSSASVVISFERFGHNNYYFFRQLLFAGLGLTLLALASRWNYHFWRQWNRPILFFTLIFLALVLVPGLGFKPGGARSWFRIGSFLFQPSEFAKLAMIFYFASWFERKKDAEVNFWFGIMPPLLVTALILGLIVLEPDIGTAAVIGIIVLTMLFGAGAKFKYLGLLAAAGLGSLWILIKAAPYRAARIITFLDPSLDPRGIGYHLNQALLAIGSGGLLGYGFGASRQKFNYLPETIGDSIFAVMAEEFGFLRIVLLIALYGIFVWAGLRIARTAPDRFGELAALGITGWVGFQALINIAAISGLLPLTGITLPFISYGGSSMLALCLATGVLLNISRQRI